MNNKSNPNDSADRDPRKAGPVPTLQFSETEPAIAIESGLELDQALHKAELGCQPSHPIVVSLHAHGHRLEVGLGLPLSFVSIQRSDPTPGPGFITVGVVRDDREATFFFHGWRHTGIPQRNLLPAGQARQILREFFETGIRSTIINWEPF